MTVLAKSGVYPSSSAPTKGDRCGGGTCPGAYRSAPMSTRKLAESNTHCGCTYSRDRKRWPCFGRSTTCEVGASRKQQWFNMLSGLAGQEYCVED